ncbi:MAG: PilZ domain-containing protein [Erythrobacter sp.]|nr:PilZ domain-containing protein [Erythrobacter sp.]
MKIYGVDEAACTGAVKRASPMLRSAKVVCQTGEYVCLVRDVSEDGVLLSYLHEVPGEPRIILSLANGQTYPIQRLWAGEAQAGYRFAGHAPLEEFLHESAPFNVRPVRLTVSAAARVIDGSASYGAQLLDLSAQGAKFEINTTLRAKNDAGALPKGRIISFQAHGLAPLLGEIVWCEANGASARYGVRFRSPLTLRGLAEAALRMQPLGQGAPISPGQPIDAASAASAA